MLKIGCVVQVFESSPTKIINSALPQQHNSASPVHLLPEEKPDKDDYFLKMTEMQSRIIKKQNLNNNS